MKANCISITLNISTLDSAEDLQVKYALFTDLQGHLAQDLEKLKQEIWGPGETSALSRR